MPPLDAPLLQHASYASDGKGCIAPASHRAGREERNPQICETLSLEQHWQLLAGKKFRLIALSSCTQSLVSSLTAHVPGAVLSSVNHSYCCEYRSRAAG